MNNMPELKIGVVAVSRDCFPESLSVNRRKALIDAYEKKYGKGTVYECPFLIFFTSSLSCVPVKSPPNPP